MRAALVRVPHPAAPAAPPRRRVALQRPLQELVDLRRREAPPGGGVQPQRLPQQPLEAEAPRAGGAGHRQPGREAQPPLQPLPRPRLPGAVQPVALVERHRHRPPGVQRERCQRGVLLGRAGGRVDHQQRHLRALHRGQRLRRAGALQLVGARPGPAAEAGGVDQHQFPPGMRERHVDAVAGGAGLGRHQQPLGAEQAVDQGRLAGVRASDHRQADRIRELLFPSLRRCRQQRRGQRRHPRTALGAERVQFGRAQFGEFRGRGGRGRAVDLVDRHRHRLADAAQPGMQFAVGRDAALAGVRHQHQAVGLADGLLGLPLQRAGEAVPGRRDAAGVDQHAGARAVAQQAVAPVPGHPGQVGDQRPAAPGQAVEEGRLADVRPADQGDDGQHGAPPATAYPPSRALRARNWKTRKSPSRSST